MRNRDRRHEEIDHYERVDWPDADLEVDDEAFAQAIAEGREAEVAA